MQMDDPIRLQARELVRRYLAKQKPRRDVVSEQTPSNTSGGDRFVEPPVPRGAAERMTGTGTGSELGDDYYGR